MGPFGKTLGLLAVATILASCSLSRSSGKLPVVKGCVLPQDQSGTLTGKWNITPIPVAFSEQSNFSQQEMQLVAGAVSTWNSFFADSMGLQPLDIGANGYNVSSMPHPTNLCQPIVSGSSFTAPIVIYKLGTWPAGYNPKAIAITTTCPTQTADPKPFYGAVMELNYANFFVAGTKLPDLQTIALHELGHVLGLNHSCEGTASAGVPGCNDFGVSSSYAAAVMAPTFSFDSANLGEQKRALTSNDEGRANCLYDPSTGK
jgi:hypothetical protein